MKLDFLRDPSKSFPEVADPHAVTALRIWHCKYESLNQIAAFPHLRELVIGTYPDESLQPLAALTQLRHLSIVHFPKVNSLAPLAGLAALETLSLSTSPSWDASGKRTVVSSFAPIAALPNLRHLELFGITPEDDDISVLKKCTCLISARFSGLPHDEMDKLRRETGWSDDFAPASSFD